jgi:hypothetical protein
VGVGAGGTAPGVGAGRTTQGSAGTFSPSVNPGAAAVQQNQAAQRNASSQTPAAQKAMNSRAGANARTNAAGTALPTSPNANTQTRQMPTPRRNVIPGQQRSAAVQDRNALRRGATGTISAINGNTLTFNTANGASTLTLTPESQVMLNGQTSTLADLPANANVQVLTNPSNPTEIQRIVATTNTTGTTPGTTATTTGGSTTVNPDGSTSRNPLGFEGLGNDIAVPGNPNGTRENQADPRRAPDQPFSTRTAEKPTSPTTTGSTNASGSTTTNPDGSPTSRNPLGFEGLGNDVAVPGNPNGARTNTNGTTTQTNGTETQADPRRSKDQPFAAGANQGTPGARNQSADQRQGGTNNTRTSSGITGNSQQIGGQTQGNASAGTRGKAGMTGGQTANGQTAATANLGATLQQTSKGVLVSNVASGGVAARGSLQQGDVITAINGQNVSSPQDVTSVLSGLAPNSSVELQILRNGQTVTQTVALPQNRQTSAPRTAEQVAEENRHLQQQIDAERNRDKK